MDFRLLYLALNVDISMDTLYCTAHICLELAQPVDFYGHPVQYTYIGLELAHPVDIALSGLVIGRSGGGGGREVVVGLGEGEEGGWWVQANFGQFSIGGGGGTEGGPEGGGAGHKPK